MVRGFTYLKDVISSSFTCFRQPFSSCLAVDDDNGKEDTKFKSITSTFSDELLQQLPEDVVVKHIFDCLDFTTRIRLSGVSRSWRRLSGLSLPPNLDMPWLVLKTDWRSSTHILHNLNLNTTHRPCAGGAVANYLIPGGSHGQYLVIISHTLKGASSMLYNPFTGDCTPLPSWYKESSWLSGARNALARCCSALLCSVSEQPGQRLLRGGSIGFRRKPLHLQTSRFLLD